MQRGCQRPTVKLLQNKTSDTLYKINEEFLTHSTKTWSLILHAEGNKLETKFFFFDFMSNKIWFVENNLDLDDWNQIV